MTSPKPDTYDDRYLEYFAFFNRREFWQCHEVLEDLWHDCASGERYFYQGLIQFAAAFHLLWRRNMRGFERLLSLASLHLEPYPALHHGLDLGVVRQSIDYWSQRALHRSPLEILKFEDEYIPRLELSTD
ncbi:MAG: DUF309 domain-containing protein [Candidatus Sumerlaeaceae bacterium]|nr:DUF309 domain-containing protein [Candidatus Sumerlaeaceae bacterium]